MDFGGLLPEGQKGQRYNAPWLEWMSQGPQRHELAGGVRPSHEWEQQPETPCFTEGQVSFGWRYARESVTVKSTLTPSRPLLSNQFLGPFVHAQPDEGHRVRTLWPHLRIRWFYTGQSLRTQDALPDASAECCRGSSNTLAS